MTAGQLAWVGGALALLLGGRPLIDLVSRRRRALERLATRRADPIRALRDVDPEPLLVQRVVPPWIAAAVAFVALRFLTQVDVAIALACAVMAWTLVRLGLDWAYRRRVGVIESQLADAVDLMASSVRAGTGVVEAMEGAAEEARRPLGPELEELVTRLRLGEEPARALRSFAQSVPLELVRLLTFALAVHWQAGGSISDALTSVSRSTRDRIAIGRRMRAQSTEAQLSALGVLGITYLLALVMWRSDPDRFLGFVRTSYGSFVVAGTIALQAVGLLWMSKLTRIDV